MLEVEVLREGAVQEVYYDLATGAVVHEASEMPEADEAVAIPQLSAQIAQGTISIRSALQLAASRYREDAIEAVELQVVGGRTVVSVVVREPTGARRYLHDPATGELVSDAAGAVTPDDAQP